MSITGGTVSASSINVGRSNLIDTTQPATGSTTQGIYVNGGVLNVAGVLNLAGNDLTNSSVSMRIDSGSVTVGGAVFIDLNNGGRWSVVDVNGGSLVSSDTSANGGIVLGGGYAGNSLFQVRAGTASVQQISFGYGAVSGNGVVNLTGGDLYVGALGINFVSGAAAINLGGGVLGASAPWSESASIGITLTGGSATGVTVQTADALGNPNNITLSGSITGTGGLIKTGSGGILFLNGNNGYTGQTTISAGTLQAGSSTALGSGGLEANAGVLDLNTNSISVAYLSGSAGLITDSGTATGIPTIFTVNNQGSSTTFGGTIADGPNNTLALVANGSGRLLLTGTSTYSSGTSISGGTLAIISDSGLGASSGSLAIGPATLEVAGNAFSGRNIILNDPAATIQVDPSFTYSESGTLSGPGGLTVTGGGTLILSGTNNSFSDGTTVESGSLLLESQGAIAAGSSLTVGDPTELPALVFAARPAVATVPEPGTLALLLAGLAVGLGMWQGRKRT